jgi:NAD(P)H-binding
MPARHEFRPNRDFTARAARPNVAVMAVSTVASAQSARPALAPLVVAGGSLATGRELARQAGAAGREVRLVDQPEPGAELRAALDGAAAVVIIPARTVTSLAAQVQTILDAIDEPVTGPQIVLVTGFSIGHGLGHALNTPERLADRRRAEALVRSSGVPYTIVRPTWLTGDPPGHYAITLTQDPHADGMIARADLAAVCLAAVAQPAARGTTFAVFAQPGRAPRSWAPLFSALRRDAA